MIISNISITNHLGCSIESINHILYVAYCDVRWEALKLQTRLQNVKYKQHEILFQDAGRVALPVLSRPFSKL